MGGDEDWTEADFSDASATFGDRVTAAREALGLGAAALARQLGVKTETVQNWEADRSEPRANKLQMLAGVLNVPLIWLMTGSGEGVPTRPRSPAAGIAAELRSLRAEHLRLAGRIETLLRRIEGGG